MDYNWWAYIVAAAGITGFIAAFVRNRKLKNRIKYLLEAVRNKDFSFIYPTKDVGETERIINSSLNEIIAILSEISDEAKQREQYFELVINSVDTGILVVDEKGFILQSNYAATQLLKRKILTHIDQITPIDHKKLSVKSSKMILKNKQVTILAINDISKELQNKEMESWERLTSVLTHEIMNSVAPITSLTESLINEEYKAEEIKEGLTTINGTCKRLIDFVNNYRQVTRIPKPNPTLFYLKPFLQQMKQLALHQSKQNATEIIISINPQDLILYADENLTGHVVTNILKNALEATEGMNDGKIEIRAYSQKDEAVVIEIENNGPRIPREEEEHIFVPFFTTKENGNGIGLALSRRIMTESGGELLLKNDKNTEFVLRFP